MYSSKLLHQCCFYDVGFSSFIHFLWLFVNLAGLLTIKLVSSTGEQASGILIAAAAPVTSLTPALLCYHARCCLAGLLTIKLISSAGQQASGILIAAAAPVTSLTPFLLCYHALCCVAGLLTIMVQIASFQPIIEARSLVSLHSIVAGLLTIKLVSSTGEHTSGILIAAAAPVTSLTPALLCYHALCCLAGLLTIKLVSSTGEQASGILIAAAAPVTLLTALSKSSLGKQVQEGLNQKLPQLKADAAALKQQHAGG
jgi:hypothetical protein